MRRSVDGDLGGVADLRHCQPASEAVDESGGRDETGAAPAAAGVVLRDRVTSTPAPTTGHDQPRGIRRATTRATHSALGTGPHVRRPAARAGGVVARGWYEALRAAGGTTAEAGATTGRP